MILSKRIALGGQQLDELHERIVIQSIDPGVPHESISAVNRMGGFGQRVTGQHWETLDVSVTYGINVPKREMNLRRQIFEAVNAWALRKGWLTVNWLPNRRMYVDKVVLPDSGDPWEWTSNYTITFRAYNVPFWQDEQPMQVSSGVTEGTRLWIPLGGNVRSVVDAEFRNRSGMTIYNFMIQAGNSRITLSNLNLGGTETLLITHGTDGLMRITAGGRNVYHCYSGDDDLYVNPPGSEHIDFSADRAGILVVRHYGRYA